MPSVTPPTLPSPPAGPVPPARTPLWRVVGLALAVVVLAFILIDYARLRLRPPTAAVTPAPAVLPATSDPRNSSRPAGAEPSLPVLTAPTDRTSRTEPQQRHPASAAKGEDAPSASPTSPPPAPAVRAPPHPWAYLADARPVPRQDKSVERLTDEQIGQSIQRGVDFLLGQFVSTRLKDADRYDPETFAGLNALCVYALLHAGQAVSDPRLTVQNEDMKQLIARMKEFPMDGNRATYARSLRIAALAVHDRPEDRSTLEKDAQWLLATSIQGAYTYGKPNDNPRRDEGGWDNSNSQYGVLGVWAATEAGFRAPSSYWNEVEAHWTSSQTHSGGWGYGPGAQSATLAMTAAGVTSLFVAREQRGTILPSAAPADGSLPAAILRGLEWLDEGENSIAVDGGHRGYTLYGLERAGLASGYKFFGKHDWYLELAAKAIAEQKSDGSWEGGDGTVAETAFSVLFLSRGRHPIFVSKLRFAGNWANRPRDIANLTRFAGRELERPLNWQTVGTERDWTEWTDSPVLFIATDQPPDFSDAVVEKLRAYAEAGGLIFTHADKNSPAVTRYVETLASGLFPEYPYEPIPENHLVYSTMFQVETKPPLFGVSNGSRLLLVHSPTDLGRAWTVRPIRSNRPSFETAVNVIVYAAGRREFRNRLNSIYVAPLTEQPGALVPVARLKYRGNWDPEPAAWGRFGRILQKQTGLSIAVKPTEVTDLTSETAPIAHLTGTAAVTLADDQLDALRQFVARGGVLLIEAAGGSGEFAQSVRKDLLPKLFPASELRPLDESHPLVRGMGPGMADLSKPRFRPYAMETRGPRAGQLMAFEAGKGVVIFSDLDISSGLLGATTWGIAGYQPASAEAVARNVVLWTIQRIRAELAPPPTATSTAAP